MTGFKHNVVHFAPPPLLLLHDSAREQSDCTSTLSETGCGFGCWGRICAGHGCERHSGCVSDEGLCTHKLPVTGCLPFLGLPHHAPTACRWTQIPSSIWPNIKYNTTLLSLCREICLLARHLHKTLNTFYSKTSTIQ